MISPRCSLLAVALSILALPAQAAHAADSIAVLEFVGDGSIEDSVLVFLADKVRDLARQELDPAAWEVMARESTQIEAAAIDPVACEGGCEQQIGQLLGAKRVIAGGAVSFDDALTLDLRLIDVADGQLLGREEVSAVDLDGLLGGLEGGCAALMAPEPVPVEPAPEFEDLDDEPAEPTMRTRRGRKKPEQASAEELDELAQVPGEEERTGPKHPYERPVRIGFSGFASLEGDGSDGALLGMGPTLLPNVHVMFGAGLGIRVGLAMVRHSGTDVGSSYTPQGVDMTYYLEYRDPETLTTERTDATVSAFGALLDFEYEVTVPESSRAYAFFRRVQPFVGAGVGLMSVKTEAQLGLAESDMFEDESYAWVDPEAGDEPGSTQFRLGLDLFGGIHVNVTNFLRFSLEVGYLLIDVPGGEKEGVLENTTEGHYARHESFRLDDLRIGGGFAVMF